MPLYAQETIDLPDGKDSVQRGDQLTEAQVTALKKDGRLDDLQAEGAVADTPPSDDVPVPIEHREPGDGTHDQDVREQPEQGDTRS